jgi:hypothetical protein
VSPWSRRFEEFLYGERLIPLMIDNPHAEDEIEEVWERIEGKESHREKSKMWHAQYRLKQCELEPAPFNWIKSDCDLRTQGGELEEKVAVTASDIRDPHPWSVRNHR